MPYNKNQAEPEYDYYEDDDEIDIMRLLGAIKKHAKIILIISILAALLTMAYLVFFVTPMYRSDFTIYVNNRADPSDQVAVSSSDISASRSLASTYSEIITGRTVLLEAAGRCGLSALPYKTLLNLVEVKTSSTSELITVYVQGTSPENSLYFARAIGQSASAQINSIVDGSSMRIVDEPVLPDGKYSPHYIRSCVIAFVAAAFLLCVLFAILEMLDDTVKDDKTLEDRTGIPVLGMIPDVDAAKAQKNKRYYYGDYEQEGKKNG